MGLDSNPTDDLRREHSFKNRYGKLSEKPRRFEAANRIFRIVLFVWLILAVLWVCLDFQSPGDINRFEFDDVISAGWPLVNIDVFRFGIEKIHGGTSIYFWPTLVNGLVLTIIGAGAFFHLKTPLVQKRFGISELFGIVAFAAIVLLPIREMLDPMTLFRRCFHTWAGDYYPITCYPWFVWVPIVFFVGRIFQSMCESILSWFIVEKTQI